MKNLREHIRKIAQNVTILKMQHDVAATLQTNIALAIVVAA